MGASAVLYALLCFKHAFGTMDGLNSKDIRRMYQRKPAPSSGLTGSHGAEAWQAINRHLLRGRAETRPCEEWKHSELNDLARLLLNRRHVAVDQVYRNRKDKRALWFDSIEYKERLWEQEADVPSNITRDGKCAEALLWYVHHLSQEERSRLATEPNFMLPLMPVGGPQVSDDKEYTFAVQCSTCHTHDPSLPAPVDPAPKPAPQTCPVDPSTGKPHNWYNRSKRCDWDYDPPCKMCEGIGGYIWGDGEDQIHFGECEPLASPDEIPQGNLTSPVWPEAFSVKAYNVQMDQTDQGGPFPGGDPCDTSHNFEIQYQHFDYDGRDGARPFTKFSQNTTYEPPPFGQPGGNNATAFILHYPTTNMWVEQLKPDGSTLFCMCVGVYPNGSHAFSTLGPLRHDFAAKAVLIGRERIGVEGYGGAIVRRVVADHWYLGPHHFWVDVETNLMVRAWQSWNALQTFFDWKIEVPPAATWELSASCRAQYNNQSCPNGLPPHYGTAPPFAMTV